MTPTSSTLRKTILAAALVLLPTLAQAHPGHGQSGLASGAAHPLAGIDHLLAMVAIGLWAVQLGGRALWLVPLTFVSVMALGGAAAMAGFVMPGMETVIVASLFVLAAMLIGAVRLPVAVSAAVAASFAIFHGAAHGAEMPAGASALAYGAGFLVTTALLHLTGIAAGLWLARAATRTAWLRAAGVAVLAGACLVAMS